MTDNTEIITANLAHTAKRTTAGGILYAALGLVIVVVGAIFEFSGIVPGSTLLLTFGLGLIEMLLFIFGLAFNTQAGRRSESQLFWRIGLALFGIGGAGHFLLGGFGVLLFVTVLGG
jgi:hypothetical protein